MHDTKSTLGKKINRVCAKKDFTCMFFPSSDINNFSDLAWGGGGGKKTTEFAVKVNICFRGYNKKLRTVLRLWLPNRLFEMFKVGL